MATTTSKYLDRATDFTDFKEKGRPNGLKKHPCPLCKKYGGWNLILNAYGDGVHFKASCFQCNGWGWVAEQDATCIHTYKELSQDQCRELGIKHWGMFHHVHQCETCERVASYDSSG